MRLSIVLLLICACASANARYLGRGFGEDIDWVPFDRATEIASYTNKPIFLLIHKTWCPVCARLKESFATMRHRWDFVQLSRKFVMVNAEDDEEPGDEKYSPDGRYVPRTFFLDQNGNRIRGIDNAQRHRHYRFFYDNVEDIMRAMLEVLRRY